jgi:hypothetical protein
MAMATERQEKSPRYGRTSGVDPYVDWAFSPGRASFFVRGRQQSWVSVLILLANLDVQDFADGKGFIEPGQAEGWKAAVRVSTLYQPPKPTDRGIRFVTAFVTEEFFAFLAQSKSLQKHVVRLTLGLPFDTESHSFLANADGVPE